MFWEVATFRFFAALSPEPLPLLFCPSLPRSDYVTAGPTASGADRVHSSSLSVSVSSTCERKSSSPAGTGRNNLLVLFTDAVQFLEWNSHTFVAERPRSASL